ncbi:MAG: argininosuccinate lyase [Chloroflexota bacterium]|nr:argininosuccinate lyase [Chloroflexota bacterium]
MDTHSRYTVSLHYDRRLYRQDIAGSVAHARMLARQGIIADDEAESLVAGLEGIREEIEAESFPWREELEDVHMNIERRLFETVGDVAGKLHTARSRNDQVATDVRLYVKEVIDEALRAILDLRAVFVEKASANRDVAMPGYTHVQRAQPVLFAHHMLAYFEMFSRDAERMRQARESADAMPLGSGAMAGVPYPIDRESVARELGFGKVSANSMDAVSDRDFLLDFHSAAATCAMHLSRLSEELVLWSSDEFGFVRLDDMYTTGSSIMPQKRNPDFAEIARGKTGRVYGNLVGLLTTLKGLPLTYNRDMQEDKEGLFDTVDTLIPTLQVAAGMVSTMEVQADRMRIAALNSYALATDVADYLVAKGLPFREAHGTVARLSKYALHTGKRLDELDLDTYRRFSDHFDEDVLSITVDSSIRARDVFGGTAPNRVEAAIEAAKAELESDSA